MNSMSETKPLQQPGPCLVLLSPWRKRRSIFTTPSPVGSSLVTFPMGQNPAIIPNHPPATVLSQRPHLRIVRLSPFPPIVGPRFPNSQTFNTYARMPTVIPPTGPEFPSSLPRQQYEPILQQQQELQPSENYIAQNQYVFPPTPSTTSEESTTEEITSSTQQKDQESLVMEYHELDCLETDVQNCASENSDFVNGRVSSTNEEISNTLSADKAEPNSGRVDSGRETQFSVGKQENYIFKSIDEALATIDSTNFCNVGSSNVSPDSPSLASLEKNVNRKLGTRMKVADDKQEEVVKAAKSLFSKRTRTLYHWLFPNTSKNKLKATVSAAWDTLPDNEKHFYISQVLGRFGLQASSLMINPQLDGITGLSIDLTSSDRKLSTSKDNTTEAQQAVEELFASCDDADNWASYPKPKRRITERRRKRKSNRSWSDETGGRARLGAVDPDELDEEIAILKRMREAKLEVEFEEDLELSSELEKFRLISESGAHYKDDDDDDFWRRTPDPEDLFSQMGI